MLIPISLTFDGLTKTQRQKRLRETARKTPGAFQYRGELYFWITQERETEYKRLIQSGAPSSSIVDYVDRAFANGWLAKAKESQNPFEGMGDYYKTKMNQETKKESFRERYLQKPIF